MPSDRTPWLLLMPGWWSLLGCLKVDGEGERKDGYEQCSRMVNCKVGVIQLLWGPGDASGSGGDATAVMVVVSVGKCSRVAGVAGWEALRTTQAHATSLSAGNKGPSDSPSLPTTVLVFLLMLLQSRVATLVESYLFFSIGRVYASANNGYVHKRPLMALRLPSTVSNWLG